MVPPPLQVEVARVAYEKLTGPHRGERSEIVRARVERACERQAHRFLKLPHVSCNADMGPAEVQAFCGVEPAARA